MQLILIYLFMYFILCLLLFIALGMYDWVFVYFFCYFKKNVFLIFPLLLKQTTCRFWQHGHWTLKDTTHFFKTSKISLPYVCVCVFILKILFFWHFRPCYVSPKYYTTIQCDNCFYDQFCLDISGVYMSRDSLKAVNSCKILYFLAFTINIGCLL